MGGWGEETIGIIAATSPLFDIAFKPSETFFASVVFPLPGIPETLIRRRSPGGRAESFSVVLYYRLVVRYWML